MGIYRDVRGQLLRVNWNYVVHVNGILAVDSYGDKHLVAGRDWATGLQADDRNM